MSKTRILCILLWVMSCKNTPQKSCLNDVERSRFKEVHVKYEYEEDCDYEIKPKPTYVSVSFSNEWNDSIIAVANEKVVFSNFVETNSATGIAKQFFALEKTEVDELALYIIGDSTFFTFTIDKRFVQAKLYKKYDGSITVRMSNCITLAY